MSEVLVVATIAPAAGKKDDMAQGFSAMAQQAKDNEPGVLLYEYYWDDENNEFVFVEKYKDEATFEAHRNSPAMQESMKKAQAEGAFAKEPVVKVMKNQLGGFKR